MVVESADVPLGTPSTTPADWYVPYVSALNAQGKNLLTNMSWQELNQPAQRGELAELITFAFGVKQKPVQGTLFRDISASTPHAAAIEALRERCVFTGDDVTGSSLPTFRSTASINRAEAAKVFAVVMVKVQPKGFPASRTKAGPQLQPDFWFRSTAPLSTPRL